ncbi:MAG: hypothetical protein QXR30_02835 [Candidatus Woesearchaeota archaeon]
MPENLEEKIRSYSNLVKLVAVDQVDFELMTEFLEVINKIIENHPKGYYYLTSKDSSVEDAKKYSGISGIDFRISTWYYEIRRFTRDVDPYLDFLLREVYEPFKNKKERYNIYNFSERNLQNTSSYDVFMEDLATISYIYPQVYVAGRELVEMFFNGVRGNSQLTRQVELLESLIETYRDSFRLFQESARSLLADYRSADSQQFRILMRNLGARYKLLKDNETRFREKLADFLINDYLPYKYGHYIDERRLYNAWEIF